MSTFGLESSEEVRRVAKELQTILIEKSFKQSLWALDFSLAAHASQKRDDGRPYILHPLRMAFKVIRCKGVTDDLIAIILLHDVVEDCNVRVSDLPLSSEVSLGVELMTYKKEPQESEREAKARYYKNLSLYPLATICKLLDKIDNLRDGDGVIEKQRMARSLRETCDMLLPVATRVKTKMEGEENSKTDALLNIVTSLISDLTDLVISLAPKYHLK